MSEPKRKNQPYELVLTDVNSKQVEFSKTFKQNYLSVVENPELLDLPILTTNILFQIILDLKNNMFHTTDEYLYDPKDKKKNQTKLQLWEEEVLATDKSLIKRVYRTRQFLKNYDKEAMGKSLDFLKDYKKKRYTFENSSGKKIMTSGGLIKDWYFLEPSGSFEVHISLYWANQIVTLDKGKWNMLRHDIMRDFKGTKQRFFILWLMDVKKYVGTSKKIKDFMDTFQLNYSSDYEFLRGFLAPIKAKLDSKHLNDDWISFNYFLDENPKNVRIVPYDVNPSKEVKLDESQVEMMQKQRTENLRKAINKVTKYNKRQFKLSSELSYKMRKEFYEKDLELFERNYAVFKETIRAEKKKAADYQGEAFYNKIKEIYSQN